MKVNKSFTMCYYDRLIEFLRKLGIKSNSPEVLEAFWLIRGYAGQPILTIRDSQAHRFAVIGYQETAGNNRVEIALMSRSVFIEELKNYVGGQFLANEFLNLTQAGYSLHRQYPLHFPNRPPVKTSEAVAQFIFDFLVLNIIPDFYEFNDAIKHSK